MQCPTCGNTELAVARTTEDLKTILECLDCSHTWQYESSNVSVGGSGLTKHFCPVCPHVYSDDTAPILTIGSPSAVGHRCDRTGSYKAGARWGRSEAKMDQRLSQVSDEDLAGWPLVLDLKRERTTS